MVATTRPHYSRRISGRPGYEYSSQGWVRDAIFRGSNTAADMDEDVDVDVWTCERGLGKIARLWMAPALCGRLR